jgi:hypothetical protein
MLDGTYMLIEAASGFKMAASQDISDALSQTIALAKANRDEKTSKDNWTEISGEYGGASAETIVKDLETRKTASASAEAAYN